MIRRVLWSLTGVAVLLGSLHLCLAFLAWRKWTLETLWFAGSGLAIVMAGLLNVAMMRAATIDRAQRTVWFAANLMMASFFSIAWSALPEHQVTVGVIVFASLSLGSAVSKSRRAGA